MYARFSLALIFALQTSYVPMAHAGNPDATPPGYVEKVKCLWKYWEPDGGVDEETRARAIKLIEARHSPPTGEKELPLNKAYCVELANVLNGQTEAAAPDTQDPNCPNPKNCSTEPDPLRQQSVDNSHLDRQSNYEREVAAEAAGRAAGRKDAEDHYRNQRRTRDDIEDPDDRDDARYEDRDDDDRGRHRKSGGFMQGLGDFFQNPMVQGLGLGLIGGLLLGKLFGGNSSNNSNSSFPPGGPGFFGSPRVLPGILPPRFGQFPYGRQGIPGRPGGYPGYSPGGFAGGGGGGFAGGGGGFGGGGGGLNYGSGYIYNASGNVGGGNSSAGGGGLLSAPVWVYPHTL